jgi:hypothetical protein
MLIKSKDGRLVECNVCKRPFSMQGVRTGTITSGDYEITYFSCPGCGAKYPINTTDTRQRDLIKQRLDWLEKVKVGRKKKFRPKTLKHYWREIDKIKAEQEERQPKLTEMGKKILRGE